MNLISRIKDEVVHKDHEIFFSVSNEFEEYLVHEVSDAFVLACIPQALVTQQDIKCDNISDVLFDNLKPVIYLLSKVYQCNPINIISKKIIHLDFNPQEIVTGFSGGIDSLSTFFNHTGDIVSKELRITMLALFNVGAYGNDYEKTKLCFDKDKERAALFAQEVRLPFVFMDSNISLLCIHPTLKGFAQRSILSISAAILSLQKLFKTYYISSSYTIDKLVYYKADQSKYENLLAPLLSNLTNISITETYLNRVEKTRLLMDNNICQKHLYVCASDIYNEKYNTGFDKGNFPNCGECIKCTRTLITLDFLGALQKFSNQFDLNKYLKNRNAIMKDVYLNINTTYLKLKY